MISLNNIYYSIKGKKILEDISFKALPGELLAVLGANGAGKSTILKMVRGDLKPDSGNVSINGTPLKDWKNADLAQCMAVLQQQTVLSLPFSVKEVVTMGRYPHFKGHPREIDKNIVQAAMKKAGIDKMQDRSYLHLSGGEQQRVQLARVFAQIWYCENQDIRYLLMDEPGNNLDVSHHHNALMMAKEFAAEGNCVIAILHDLNMALQYADKILLMNQGIIMTAGAPTETLNKQNISHAYGFPMNVYHHQEYGHPIILPASINIQ